MVLDKLLNDLVNTCVFRQEQHHVWRIFQCFLKYSVEVGENMFEAVFFQELIASSSPRRRNEDTVEGLFSVLWEGEVWHCVLVA